MGSTINLNSSTIETVKTDAWTTIYSDQTFSLNSNEYKYFEITTNKDWNDIYIVVGYFSSKPLSTFDAMNSFIGYAFDWTGSPNMVIRSVYVTARHNGESLANMNTCAPLRPPSPFNTYSRVGIAVSPEMIKLYVQNVEIGSYSYYNSNSTTISSPIVSKPLNICVMGAAQSGNSLFYLDPKLWTTNSAKYTSPLGNPTISSLSSLKNLKQY
jgi:hypothetical protein